MYFYTYIPIDIPIDIPITFPPLLLGREAFAALLRRSVERRQRLLLAAWGRCAGAFEEGRVHRISGGKLEFSSGNLGLNSGKYGKPWLKKWIFPSKDGIELGKMVIFWYLNTEISP